VKGLRFGVVAESVAGGADWLDHARRVEDAGVDTLLVRDHFAVGAFGQQLAPFAALASAAAVTTRLRVGSMVLSNDFRHPVLVAHEAASIHQLSGGRFELGLGAGWYQPEYAAAGLVFDPPGRRIDRLEEALTIVRGLFAGDEVQHAGQAYRIAGLDLGVLPARTAGPRILIGAGGPRMLRLAARHADIVGLLPAPIKGTDDGDSPLDRMPAALEGKLSILREAAGDRFAGLELSSFVTIRVTDRRRSGTEELLVERGWTGIDVEAVWQMPTVFLGSVEQIRHDLYERRERYGLSYLVVSDRDLPVLAQVIAAL
jgi:probable F420-dependent oxidoreductase